MSKVPYARVIFFPALLILLNWSPAHAQTGACCVDRVCVGTITEDECWDQGGQWYRGEDCDSGFDCPVCGFYSPGDYNGDGNFNIIDIVEALSYLSTGSPDAALLCECPTYRIKGWAVAFDLNNSCSFNIADVIVAAKEGPFRPCELCPPGPLAPRPR